MSIAPIFDILSIKMLVLTLTHPESLLYTSEIIEQLHPVGVEIRFDLYSDKSFDILLQAISIYLDNGVKVLFCVRKPEDGGLWEGTESNRLSIYSQVLDQLEAKLNQSNISNFYLDLEEELFTSFSHNSDLVKLQDVDRALITILGMISKHSMTLVASFHDFQKRPDGIPQRMRTLAASIQRILEKFFPDARGIAKKSNPASDSLQDTSLLNVVFKSAVQIKSSEDLLALVKESRELNSELFDHDFVCLGMGYQGLPTRILSNKLGSKWCYVSGDEIGLIESITGKPQRKENLQKKLGHISMELARYSYNFNTINSNTAVYGIIGNPVGHSKSPAFHNQVFATKDKNAVYLPFEVDDVSAFFEMAEFLDIRGLSVTVPFKNEVLPYAVEHSKEVEQIQAANTLVKKQDGWLAYNTDYLGFMAPLMDIDLYSKKATVIGAGGASKAIIYALLNAGMEVLLINRTASKAEAICQHFEQYYPGKIVSASLHVDSLSMIKEFSDLLVQTTSVGMEPDVESNPLEFYQFKGHELAYDIIYTPEKTKFLQAAKECGARIISGKDMFIKQAEEQSRLFLELL
jgi:3-dehydroquinate dehydratase/shikimate dehydrogenase